MTGLEPIEKWFTRNGWAPFDFQRATWNAFLRGESGLVHAPTGMGKTYAVWLGPLAEYLNSADSPLPPGEGAGVRAKRAVNRSDYENCSVHALTPALSQGERELAPLRVLWLTPLRAL